MTAPVLELRCLHLLPGPAFVQGLDIHQWQGCAGPASFHWLYVAPRQYAPLLHLGFLHFPASWNEVPSQQYCESLEHSDRGTELLLREIHSQSRQVRGCIGHSWEFATFQGWLASCPGTTPWERHGPNFAQPGRRGSAHTCRVLVVAPFLPIAILRWAKSNINCPLRCGGTRRQQNVSALISGQRRPIGHQSPTATGRARPACPAVPATGPANARGQRNVQQLRQGPGFARRQTRLPQPP